jgi:type VI secretion system protein ImpD/type VI secretion system protein ImpC
MEASDALDRCEDRAVVRRSPSFDDPASPLREAVLAGRFFGHRHAGAAARTAGFPTLDADAALIAWFGPAGALRLGTDTDGWRGALDRDIAAIDAMLSEQLDAILQMPRMRRFEGRWRGLAWLTDGVDRSGSVKLKLLNLSWSELGRDLERAIEFDQSQLFYKIYENEFGMPGGEPYGLLVVDHEVRHRPMPNAPGDDVNTLVQLAGVAAAAFAPTVLAASPALLQVEDFTELDMVTDLGDPFHGPEFARWRGLSAREDMRFIAIALPRVLARPPWLDDPARADGFRYAEYAPNAENRVWMSAGFAFAAVVARAFANHSWPADVRGSGTDYVGGGLVTDLPIEPFATDADRAWVRPPLDIAFSDRLEATLVEAGLMPLSALPYGEEAVFSAVRSLQAPHGYSGSNAAAATANARLSAQLNSMLCVSRFAHYLKVIGRDMVGSFKTAEEIELQLQAWLNGYVNTSLAAGPEMRARYPLVSARVNVRERAGRPGVYACIMLLQPHFQLDDVTASFRLVTDIAAPSAAA